MSKRTPRREFLRAVGLGAVAAGLGKVAAGVGEDPRPNILWILAEDICPDLSCYGVKAVQTPHLDKLASQGIRFTRAFVTAPVCSASRSAMMTGFHQNYTRANQHRTPRKKPLPYGIRPIPHLLADAGYFTCLMDRKTDCNFTTDKPLFQGRHWRQRKKGQPFFAQYTSHGTHRRWRRDPQRPIDPKDVEIPPYYPDNDFVRRDWANGLEQIQLMDRDVGKLLKQLDDAGLADNTVVFFIGDHGRCHIRGKQFLYDEGLHVPVLMRWPGKVKPGQVCDDLVMSIDISATVLDVAGVKPPARLHGESLLRPDRAARKYVFAARDKMDDTHDAMRAIRSKDYKYILNLMPERAYCQLNEYKERMYPMLALMNVMNMKGQLAGAQAAFLAAKKPPEELYDLRKDPHETRNLAADPALADIKKQLRAELETWRKAVRDEGVTEAFRKGGWPAKYPTRTLAEWEEKLQQWRGYLFEGRPHPTAKRAKKVQKKAQGSGK